MCFRRYLSTGKAEKPALPRPITTQRQAPSATRDIVSAARITPVTLRHLEEQVEAGRRAYLMRLESMIAVTAKKALGDVFDKSTAELVVFLLPEDGPAQKARYLRIVYDKATMNLEILVAPKSESEVYSKELPTHVQMRQPRVFTIDPRYNFVWLLVLPSVLLRSAMEGKVSNAFAEQTGRECLLRLGYCHTNPKKTLEIRQPILSTASSNDQTNLARTLLAGIPRRLGMGQSDAMLAGPGKHVASKRAVPSHKLESIPE